MGARAGIRKRRVKEPRRFREPLGVLWRRMHGIGWGRPQGAKLPFARNRRVRSITSRRFMIIGWVRCTTT